jgi:hypothetical protein
MSRAHRPPGNRPPSPEAAESPEWLPGKFDAAAAAARTARATPYRGGTILRKADDAAEAKDDQEEKKDEGAASSEGDEGGDAGDGKEGAAEKQGAEGESKDGAEADAADQTGDEKPAKVSAKLEGVGLKIFRAGNDDPLLKLAKKYDLNLQSPTSRQILENLGMTCEAFIGAFRKGNLKAEFPREYLPMTVQAALDADKTKVRKLLTDGRFAK